MHIRVVEDKRSFAVLADQWNDLVERSRHPDIFLTHEWLFTWWETYGRGKQLYILLCFENNNELAGVLPAYRKRTGVFPGARTVRFLGSERVTSDFLTCIAARGKEHRVYGALLSHLHHDCGKWDVIELANVEVESPFFDYMKRRYGRASGAFFHTASVKCPYALLPEDGKAFLQSLSHKARKKTRYFRNALAKRGEVSLVTVHDRDSLDTALRDAMALHRNTMTRKGWKEKFSSGKYRDFYRKVCERFLALGRLRLSFLQVNGRRIAFLNSFRYGDRIYAYHTGFDPAWAGYSVGFVLIGHLIEKAIGEGCTRYEFLRGDQRYKYEWAISGEREIAGISLYGDSCAGRVYRLAYSAREAAKKMLKRHGMTRKP